MDENIQELADSIYARKVRRARAMTVGERIDTGIELFEGSLGMMRDGIRHQFPEADENEVETILQRRLARLKQVHEHGLYSKTPI
jgi:hypothetical protein